jgi:hypothetical protein
MYPMSSGMAVFIEIHGTWMLSPVLRKCRRRSLVNLGIWSIHSCRIHCFVECGLLQSALVNLSFPVDSRKVQGEGLATILQYQLVDTDPGIKSAERHVLNRETEFP